MPVLKEMILPLRKYFNSTLSLLKVYFFYWNVLFHFKNLWENNFTFSFGYGCYDLPDQTYVPWVQDASEIGENNHTKTYIMLDD